MDPKVTIYTDGACSSNGQDGAQAGIGVYCQEDPSLNVCEPLSGRQTNQRAELKAAARGIANARANGYREVTVKTDSNYVKNGVESWMPNWDRNGWNGVKNEADFRDLRSSMEGMKVNFEKVPSKANAADNLAKKASTMCRKFIH